VPEVAVQESAESAQGGDLTAEQMLREDRRLLELKDQRRSFLVSEHLKRAQALRDRLSLRDARDELLAALSLEADNLQAKRDLAEINALLGEDYNAQVSTVAETLRDQTQIKTQQMRAEARDLLREGKLLLTKGDFDGAIAQLAIAEQTVRFAPYSIDWEGLDTEISELLQDARTKRATAAETLLLDQERSAFEALQSREKADVSRRRAVVDNMVSQAIDAFESGSYEDAIYFAEQALRKDPRNEQAEELRSSAFKAGMKATRVEYAAAKREEFKRWKEDLESYKVAWSKTITLPSPEEWSATTELRAKRRGLDIEQTRSEAEVSLRSDLSGTLIRMPEVSEEESLRALIDLIRLLTGLPLVVDPAAENAVLDEGISSLSPSRTT